MSRARFTQIYEVEVPLVAAGMAMITGPELTAAVANAGGLGILGTGPLPPPLLGELIVATRALTTRPFGVNLIVENTALGPACTDAHITVCAEHRVSPVVFFWNAPPRAWVQRLHAAGCHVWMTVSSHTGARQAVAEGFDALVVQGREAGGHVRAEAGLFTLLPAVRDACPNTIIVAAGGVADGRTAAAAFALGADAVCLGTRFVASVESLAHEDYKLAILAASADDTVVTSIYGPEWPDAPMRVIRNQAVIDAEQGVARNTQMIGRTVLFGSEYTMPLRSAVLPVRVTAGDLDQMCLAAGTSVQFIADIRPAGALVRDVIGAACIVLGQSRALISKQQ